jgi:hypothetical protein
LFIIRVSKEAQLLEIFEETEKKLKETVDGEEDPNLAATLILYSATLFENAIKAVQTEDEAFTKMACGALRQTIRKTIGLLTFMEMMNDDSMKAIDSLVDMADKFDEEQETRKGAPMYG